MPSLMELNTIDLCFSQGNLRLRKILVSTFQDSISRSPSAKICDLQIKITAENTTRPVYKRVSMFRRFWEKKDDETV